MCIQKNSYGNQSSIQQTGSRKSVGLKITLYYCMLIFGAYWDLLPNVILQTCLFDSRGSERRINCILNCLENLYFHSKNVKDCNF